MAQVTFEVPDDFVPMKGVAMLSGWREGNPPHQMLYSAYLPDTAEWDRVMLFREGHRGADARMSRVWSDPDAT